MSGSTRVQHETPPGGHPSLPRGAVDPGFVKAVAGTFLVKASALALMLTVFQPTYWFNHLILDVFAWRGFWADAQHGLIPYVDMSREYPVLAGLLYWLLSPIMDPEHGMGMLIVHGSVMLAADVVAAALAWACFREISPRHAVAATLALALNLTSLTHAPFRFESVLVVFVLAGWHAHLRGRPTRAALWWSLGCLVKWYPALLLALQEVQALTLGQRRQWRRSLAVFAAVSLVNVPFLLAGWIRRGSIDAWLYPYWFHAHRPLYWDTPYGLWQLWVGPMSMPRLGSVLSLTLVALALVLRPRAGIEGKAVLVCLAALPLNSFYSSQYHLWFYPFLIALVLRERDRRRAWALALAGVFLDVASVLTYPFALTYAFTEMGGFAIGSAAARGGPWTAVFTAAVLARMVAVGMLAALVWRSEATRGDGARVVPSLTGAPATA